MKKEIYHSALNPEFFNETGIKKIIKNGNEAFQFDINEYFEISKDIDLIYSEPSWIDGYEKFIERSEMNSKYNFDDYLYSIANIIKNTDLPIVLIIGKSFISKLPDFNSKIPIKLHGYKTFMYGWLIDLKDFEANSNYEVIKKLSEKYNKVWDFCCGYGNTGRIFKENGKSFVMSDINEKCITYVAKNII